MEVLSAASPPRGIGGGDGDDCGDDGAMVIVIMTVMMVEMVTGLQPQIQLKKKKKKEPELISAEFRSPVQGLAFIKCSVNVCERMNEFTHCAESLNV